LSLVAEARGNVRDRIPIVRIAGMNEPIPLRSLGDGMQRMLGIALALVNAKDGVLLVDEVENGLHYTILPQLWRLIFETARRLNVQVFATSHSWECIQAFQQAAEEDTESEGLLIRLQLKGEEIVAVVVDEEHLGIATSERIEVR
jgi:AAA15 family ATPase/GTPase